MCADSRSKGNIFKWIGEALLRQSVGVPDGVEQNIPSGEASK